MTARKTTTVVEENAPEDGEYTEVLDADQDEEARLDALDGMIAEFSGAADTVVNVYRQGEGKNLSFLFRTNPDEMTGGEIMERCRDNYGTGDFRVHIRKGSRLVKNAPFSVEAKKEPDPASVQANSGMDITAVMAMMQENNNRTMQMFSETMKAVAGQNNNAPVFDPVAAQASLMQQLAALKQMSEPKDDSKSAVTMLIQGIELASKLAPKDGETNSTDVLLEGIKQFAPAIASMANMPRAPAPGTGAQIGPPLDAQAAADAEREKNMGIRNMVLRQQLGFLVKQAESGKNPDLYAELLLDQLGEVVVLDFIAKPDALDQLGTINPGVMGQRVWFEQLRAAILELTGPDPAGETEVEGELIPASQPEAADDAISNAAIDGDATSDPVGDGGNAPNA